MNPFELLWPLIISLRAEGEIENNSYIMGSTKNWNYAYVTWSKKSSIIFLFLLPIKFINSF